TTASAARRRATSSASSWRRSRSTSPRRSSASPPVTASPCATRTAPRARAAGAAPVSSTPWPGPSSGTTSACCRRRTPGRPVATMARAGAWYAQRLLAAPDAGPARRYLRERGIDGDVVREFRLGWAPDSWDALVRALRLDRELAEGTGLARYSRGRLHDHFRARVTFPIYAERGDPLSFGGRILPGGERQGNRGKYVNTAETPLYSKSKVLYGLDRAKTSIVGSGTAVVCEGYTDVIGFHRAGVPLAVATCGTALTDDHVRLLTRFGAQRLVLALDADSAGRAAAERFYAWEREHELEVAVADLPPGQDPA